MAKVRQISYLSLGLLSLATGLAGLVLPLLPTTVFMLIAAWAFARSSERLHRLLLDHPRFGPAIRAWQAHGAIPRRAKWLALAGLATSLVITTLVLAERPVLLLGVGAVLGAVAVFVLTRPEGPAANPIS
jgi:uncharacterized membrane protein YbaN (DUF454 family)